MGCKQSSNTQFVEHSNCGCDLYVKYNHCCRMECFGMNTNEIKTTLKTTLRKYDAEFLIDIIMTYLPVNNQIMHYSGLDKTDYGISYHTYTYPAIAQICDDSVAPCSIWLESITCNLSNKYGPKINVVICGDNGTGKKNLLQMYSGNAYNGFSDYDPTINEQFQKPMSVHGNSFFLDIEYINDRNQVFISNSNVEILEAKVFIICFSITNRHTFDSISWYRERILTIKKDSNCGIILCVTKCDLEDQRQIMRSEIIEKAAQWNVPFIETSAKHRNGLEFLYQHCLYTLWMCQ
eukprot:378163_1